MRVYGRVYNEDGTYKWVTVTTDENGFNDAVNITWLCQVLKLNLNESPFFSNLGIPAVQSVASQVAPDYYVGYIQQLFAQYFTSLIIYKKTILNAKNVPTPTYFINIVTQYGSKISLQVPV